MVKNSWGEHFGDKGYFWVSYDTFSSRFNYYVLTDVQEKKENIYQFDTNGMEGYHWRSEGRYYIANEYQREMSRGAEEITDVAFYNYNAGITHYQVWVSEAKDWRYREGNRSYISDQDLDGVLIAQGSLDHSGYFTIPVDTSYILNSDQFVVKMKIQNDAGSAAGYTAHFEEDKRKILYDSISWI